MHLLNMQVTSTLLQEEVKDPTQVIQENNTA